MQSLTSIPFSLAATLCAVSPGLAQGPSLDRDVLAGIVEPILTEANIPGAVVGVVRGQDLVLAEAFGLRDRAENEPMRRDDLFQVGSVSKTFTATLLALLAAEGKLAWDDPLAAHWPEDQELPEPIAALTLAQIACHSSGLPREPVNRRDRPKSPSVMEPYSHAELYAGLRDTELEFEPGSRLSYSNLGYAILGHVVECAAGSSYEEYLQEELCLPLGMPDTGVQMDAAQKARLATCYWPGEDPEQPREPWIIGEVCGFAGVFSSVDDLARLLALQWAPAHDLPLDALHDLHEPRIDAPEGRKLGRGWMVDAMPGVGPVIAHGGEVDGFSSMVVGIPRVQVGMIVLCNMGDDSAERLIRPLMEKGLPLLLRR